MGSAEAKADFLGLVSPMLAGSRYAVSIVAVLAEIDSLTSGAEMRISRADAACLPASADWVSLVNGASEPNPFFEPWFFVPALSHLSDDRKIWLAEYREHGQLCGFYPMAVRDTYGRTPARHVGNWAHYQCFIGNPLIKAGSETAFWRHLLLALDREDWAAGFLSAAALPEHGPAHRGLIDAAQSLGRPCPVVHRQERALLSSDLQGPAYLEAYVRAKKRKEWRRLDNRLAELGEVRFETLRSSQDLKQWSAEFLALESGGWKGKDGAALDNSDATRRFFVAATEGALAAEKLDFQRLSLDGRPIAMLLNFMTPPGSWSFKIAYNEALSRFSPGVMIELRNLDRVLSDPVITWMDSCAVENHPMIDSLWAQRRAIVQVSVPLSGVRRLATYHLCRAAETASATLKSVMKIKRHA